MIFKEAAPLAFENAAESGLPGLPFDPDWERFFMYEDWGVLKVMTARRGPRLIGWVTCFVSPHIDARTVPFADVKTIWLDKQFREGVLGMKMLKHAIEDLEAGGIKLIHVAAKNERFGKVLERLGFGTLETVYSRLSDVERQRPQTTD